MCDMLVVLVELEDPSCIYPSSDVHTFYHLPDCFPPVKVHLIHLFILNISIRMIFLKCHL